MLSVFYTLSLLLLAAAKVEGISFLLMGKLKFKETCLRPWGRGGVVWSPSVPTVHGETCFPRRQPHHTEETESQKHSALPAGRDLSQVPADSPVLAVVLGLRPARDVPVCVHIPACV